MDIVERRKELRHNIWLDATVYAPNTKIKAIATEISGDGLRIQSQKIIFPDTKIIVSLKLDDPNQFHGKVIWNMNMLVDTLSVYDMGIQTNFIKFRDIKYIGFSEKYDVVQNILAKIK